MIAFRSKSGQRDRILQHYLKGILFCNRCEQHERTSRLIYMEAMNRFGARYGNIFLCRGRQDGVCDLPYLPADNVERAIVDHYATLNLPTMFVSDVRELLQESLAGEQRSVAELHAVVSRKLKELEAKEDRLLDLLADDQLPKSKVKAKLLKIQAERTAAEISLASTGAELAMEPRFYSTQRSSCLDRERPTPKNNRRHPPQPQRDLLPALLPRRTGCLRQRSESAIRRLPHRSRDVA